MGHDHWGVTLESSVAAEPVSADFKPPCQNYFGSICLGEQSAHTFLLRRQACHSLPFPAAMFGSQKLASCSCHLRCYPVALLVKRTATGCPVTLAWHADAAQMNNGDIG